MAARKKRVAKALPVAETLEKRIKNVGKAFEKPVEVEVKVEVEKTPEPAPEKLAEPTEPVPVVYTIPDGKAISCRKGNLPEGTIVKPEDFADGQNTIDDLFNRGLLLKG